MKELFNELFKAITMILSSVLSLATVTKNTTDAAVEVSVVIKDAATKFRMEEAIHNAEELRKLRTQYQQAQEPTND